MLAGDADLGEQLAALETAIVCAESWHADVDADATDSRKCCVELGSQTDHSRLVGLAKKIVSL